MKWSCKEDNDLLMKRDFEWWANNIKTIEELNVGMEFVKWATKQTTSDGARISDGQDAKIMCKEALWGNVKVKGEVAWVVDDDPRKETLNEPYEHTNTMMS